MRGKTFCFVAAIFVSSIFSLSSAFADESPALQEPFKFQFKNGASLKLYGKFEMLSYYDTTIPYYSDWFMYVYPETSRNGIEDSYSMSVRASPIGFTFNLPNALRNGDINAKLEIDFSGGFTSGAFGTYSPLMRLKQMWISWDSKRVSVLLGQHFALFSPLFPDVGSWILLGTAGNPWMRLPQIRLTTKFDPVKFEISANRPMGANEAYGNQGDDIISDGEKSNLPFMVGRLSYSKDFKPMKVSTGVSGVFGREKIYRNTPASTTCATSINDCTTTAAVSINKTLNMWMAGYDLELISKYVDFKGEAFIGDNLNQFFAGILQGVNTTTNDATVIRTYGGWGQVTLKPVQKVYFNLGAGVDNPDDSDLTNGQRAYNLMAYGSANYKLTQNWTLSLEPSYMKTGYKNASANDNIRGMLKTSFSF